MDLRDYREKPDDGLFEKIQHRLAVRRAMRVGGAVLAGVAVVSVAAVLLFGAKGQRANETAGLRVDESTSQQVNKSAGLQVNETAGQLVVAQNQTLGSEARQSAVTADEQPVRTTVIVPVDTSVTEEDHAYLAAMLPQGTPVVATLNEAVAEQKSATVAQTAVEPEGTLNESTPSTRSAETAAPKAGQPVPHFDNVIWAPNVIIPDGDVDENRLFSIKSTSAMTSFNMQIYNRQGRRIFLTTDPAFTWDATIEGARVPQGAYVWVATFRDSDGNPRQEQGTVTVIR